MRKEWQTMFDPVEALTGEFPDAVEGTQEFRGELTILVAADHIGAVCRYCRDSKGLEYNFLSDVAGVDYYPQEPRFAVSYHLYSMVHNRSLRLKVYLPGDKPELPSVTEVYPAANWSEREIFDLFGVVFSGHPDLRRLLMPDGWDGHPLRKDYPLGYETVQFSFNFDEIDRHKPYARE
jgi:NADH-quinone oxidoreductase subunit C